MSAPKGNQFWKARSSHGCNPKFASSDKLWEACAEYFEWIESNPLKEVKAFSYLGDIKLAELPKMRAMTIAGLCIFLDINRSTWVDYKAREGFAAITARVEEIIRNQKFEGAAADLLNANIIARELGLADRAEHSGPDGAPIAVMDVSDADRAKALAAFLARTKSGGKE